MLKKNPTYISLEITNNSISVEDMSSKLFDITIINIESLFTTEKNNLTIEYKDERNIGRKLEIFISEDKFDKTIEEVTSIIKQLKQ